MIVEPEFATLNPDVASANLTVALELAEMARALLRIERRQEDNHRAIWDAIAAIKAILDRCDDNTGPILTNYAMQADGHLKRIESLLLERDKPVADATRPVTAEWPGAVLEAMRGAGARLERLEHAMQTHAKLIADLYAAQPDKPDDPEWANMAFSERYDALNADFHKLRQRFDQTDTAWQIGVDLLDTTTKHHEAAITRLLKEVAEIKSALAVDERFIDRRAATDIKLNERVERLERELAKASTEPVPYTIR